MEVLHCVRLKYPLGLTRREEMHEVARFVGPKGKTLKHIEEKLNISIHIPNRKSNKCFRQIHLKHQLEHGSTGLYLLIKMKKNAPDRNHIEKRINDEWNSIDITHIRKIRSVQRSLESDISPDPRWKPKHHKQTGKYKQKLCQNEEIEVPPQPMVKPLSMPKQIEKSNRTKRR